MIKRNVTVWMIAKCPKPCEPNISKLDIYEGWNFNSGNYLFTTDTK